MKNLTYNEFRSKYAEKGFDSKNVGRDWAKFKEGKFSFTKATPKKVRSPKLQKVMDDLKSEYKKLNDLREKKTQGKGIKVGAISETIRNIKALAEDKKKLLESEK